MNCISKCGISNGVTVRVRITRHLLGRKEAGRGKYKSSDATKKRQHDDYKAVFASVHDPLRDLLNRLCALCDQYRRESVNS